MVPILCRISIVHDQLPFKLKTTDPVETSFGIRNFKKKLQLLRYNHQISRIRETFVLRIRQYARRDNKVVCRTLPNLTDQQTSLIKVQA